MYYTMYITFTVNTVNLSIYCEHHWDRLRRLGSVLVSQVVLYTKGTFGTRKYRCPD